MTPDIKTKSARAVDGAPAGRNCPYCRFALKAGVAVLECPACGSLHHAECWSENGGCSVHGCPGAPATAAAGGKPPEPPSAAPTAEHPTQILSSTPPPPMREGPSRGMVFAVVLLALAIAGGATVIAMALVSKDGRSGPRTHTVQSTAEPNRAEQHVAKTPHRSRTVSPPPTVTPPDNMNAAIQTLLLSYYDAVVQGDMSKAWSLLSPSYKQWKLSTGGGKSDWLHNEGLNRRYLDPSGLQISFKRYDASTGVATVMVTGMTYDRPGQPTCDYKGVTWALYDGHEWLYDQGYAHDPARAAEWRPRKDETLGTLCEENDY